MRLLFRSLFFILTAVAAATSQVLFPGAAGTALIDSLVRHYKPATVLTYNPARDRMYALIDNHNDSVTCVYTGYQVFVPYNDPNPRSYTNGVSPIMNAEHTWPESKGAVGNAYSDLHHLYPTNEYANSARGSLPFGDISDPQTNRWWRGVTYTTTVPLVEKDLYSRERTGVSFQPQKEHRGNAARSMFYFYTMYQKEADAADQNFFNNQKDVLFVWHKADPADAGERARTDMIAAWQDGKPNPFILDSTLVRRCYFTATGLSEPPDPRHTVSAFTLDQNYPNPFNDRTQIGVTVFLPVPARLEIYNIRGLHIATLFEGMLTAGHHRFEWTAGPGVPSGVYLCRLHQGGYTSAESTKKLILIK